MRRKTKPSREIELGFLMVYFGDNIAVYPVHVFPALVTLSFPPYDFRFLLLTRNNQSELCFYPRSFVGSHLSRD